MAEVKIDYSSALDQVSKYYGQASDQWRNILTGNARPGTDEFNSIMNHSGVSVEYAKNGSVIGYYKNASIDVTGSTTPTVPNNSNTIPATTDYGSTEMSIPMNTAAEEGEFTEIKQSPLTNPKNANEKFTKVTPNITGIAGGILNAYVAGAVGISMGKTITNILYQVNPDIYNGIDPNTINYKDYYGNVAGGIFNAILGTDTTTGKTQAYLDINDFAAIALALQNKGVFDTFNGIPSKIEGTNNFNYIGGATSTITGYYKDEEYTYTSVWQLKPNEYPMAAALKEKNPPPWRDNNHTLPTILMTLIYKYNDKCYNVFDKKSPIYPKNLVTQTNYHNGTIVGHDIYSLYWSDRYGGPGNPSDYKFSSNISFNIPLFNTIAEAENYLNTNDFSSAINKGIDGIGTQDGAKTPDLSGVDQSGDNAIADAIQKIYDLLPSLKDNAVTQTVVQPDGSTKEITYVPIAIPDNIENPTSSDNSTQADPTVDPSKMTDPSTDPLLKTIIALLLKQTDTPTDTGDGDTPVVVPPIGSANALYSIYNPSQAQLNSFGAWLWSSNFVDQLLKLFNDPMQAIIGLHKVFATPPISGSGTIKVGYLDSGVSSNIVGNQYTTVDCGSVSLVEYFGNVFDYEPYTKVNLYLPFIGIVPLNVGEIMRSTIRIIYHVDVLTGACLAEVKINRDSAGGTLFQYSGNAAVQYPISSGSYMSIISGIMSLAGGVAGTIATGGAAMPVLLGAGASVGRMHTDISHSGSFSGNAGAMGIKKPYLIIDRPQTALAKNFPNYIGYPSNFTATIGSCNGFVKVLECHLENINATKSELEEIDSTLKEGVII